MTAPTAICRPAHTACTISAFTDHTVSGIAVVGQPAIVRPVQSAITISARLALPEMAIAPVGKIRAKPVDVTLAGAACLAYTTRVRSFGPGFEFCQ
jgi:hypothetical protein